MNRKQNRTLKLILLGCCGTLGAHNISLAHDTPADSYQELISKVTREKISLQTSVAKLVTLYQGAPTASKRARAEALHTRVELGVEDIHLVNDVMKNCYSSSDKTSYLALDAAANSFEESTKLLASKTVGSKDARVLGIKVRSKQLKLHLNLNFLEAILKKAKKSGDNACLNHTLLHGGDTDTDTDATPTPDSTATPVPTTNPIATPTPTGGTTHTHGAHSIPDDQLPRLKPGSSTFDLKATSEQAPADDTGAFRTVCDASHYSYDDPIVFPNQPGMAHLHLFFGNTLANAYSTATSLRTTGNSTCRGGIANRSAYWMPAIISGGTTLIHPDDSNFYYKPGYGIPNAGPQITTPPAGIRVLAGNSGATTPQNDAALYWDCFERYTGKHKTIAEPTCYAGEHLQATIVFPQCWNGRDLDSPDHKAHMAYPDNGACPSTHPVIIPEVSFHILFPLTAETASTYKTQWRLASDKDGTPGGVSLHGDWFEAWDHTVMDAWRINCLNAKKDCHSHLVGDGREIF